MATIHLVDPDGREHWAEEDSNFAKSGLESGHLRPAGQSVSRTVEETGEETEEQGDSEQVEETGEETEDAAVEQDGDGEDAVSDAGGSGDAKRAPRGSRRR
jgi:hypothetical protein